MKRKTVIFGAGGHGKVVLDILLESGVPVLGFIDEDPAKAGRTVAGRKILGGWSYLEGKKSIEVALGVGGNKVRRRVFDRVHSLGLRAATAVHPKVAVSRSASLGEGAVVMAGAVINAGAVLEEGVVVNTAASVDHDCLLRRFCQVWPGAHLAGTVEVGELSYVGVGASVIQNIKIGAGSLIGAGAAVVRDIPDGVVAVGVPAKPVKKHES